MSSHTKNPGGWLTLAKAGPQFMVSEHPTAYESSSPLQTNGSQHLPPARFLALPQGHSSLCECILGSPKVDYSGLTTPLCAHPEGRKYWKAQCPRVCVSKKTHRWESLVKEGWGGAEQLGKKGVSHVNSQLVSHKWCLDTHTWYWYQQPYIRAGNLSSQGPFPGRGPGSPCPVGWDCQALEQGTEFQITRWRPTAQNTAWFKSRNTSRVPAHLRM